LPLATVFLAKQNLKKESSKTSTTGKQNLDFDRDRSKNGIKN